MLGLLDEGADAPLLISGERASALKLGNVRAAADPGQPVRLKREAWLGQQAAVDLVDAGKDISRGPIGPLSPLEAGEGDGAALTLARLAGLLPALWVLGDIEGTMRIAVGDVDDALGTVELVTRARLPLDDLPPSQIAVFRDFSNGEEHVALVIGAFAGQPPLVRLHSECLTGDVFGSLKCDCGPQLDEALRILGEAGGGVLLYLRQEGRGIGLANKIRAYALQDQGADTVDANRRLGFVDDARDYRIAAGMLEALKIDRVRLLTNNPNKVAGLEDAGIDVVERVAHHLPTNPHNADYIATKKARSGHLD